MEFARMEGTNSGPRGVTNWVTKDIQPIFSKGLVIGGVFFQKKKRRDLTKGGKGEDPWRADSREVAVVARGNF